MAAPSSDGFPTLKMDIPDANQPDSVQDLVIINDEDIITITPDSPTQQRLQGFQRVFLPRKPGMENRGNQCFMNSVFQCLAVSPCILGFINKYAEDDTHQAECSKKYELGRISMDDIPEYIKGIFHKFNFHMPPSDLRILSKIAKNTKDIFTYICFKDIIQKLQLKQTPVISSGKFLSVIREVESEGAYEHLFNGSQNDPHEFLAYILDKLHNAKSSSVNITIPQSVMDSDEDIYHRKYLEHLKSRYEKDFSYFVMNLYYYIINIVECSACGNQSIEVSPNDVICLPLPEDWYQRGGRDINLDECFNEMFKIEMIDYKCEKCGNQKDNRLDKKILTKPETIIIKLKRYANFGPRIVKVSNMINYPTVLNIDQYHCGQDLGTYKLYGVINHIGSMNVGHYYSYVNDNPGGGPDGCGTFSDQWFECNDERTHPISMDSVLRSPNAYMLFYHSSG